MLRPLTLAPCVEHLFQQMSCAGVLTLCQQALFGQIVHTGERVR